MTQQGSRIIEFRQPAPGECDLLWQIALNAKRYWGYDEAFMQSCRDELKVTPEKLQSRKFYYNLGEYEGSVCGFAAFQVSLSVHPCRTA